MKNILAVVFAFVCMTASADMRSLVSLSNGFDTPENIELAVKAGEMAQKSKSCIGQPEWIGSSKGKSSPGNPVFFVMCSKGENLFYSKSQILAGGGSGKIKAVSQSEAASMCVNKIRSSVARPNTLDIAYITGRATRTTTSGNVIITQVFSSKNAAGERIEKTARCLVTSNGKFEFSIL